MDAVRSVLPAGARHVLDLGAGTGKLTSVLLDLGLDVIAVEPDDAMRALVDPRATGLAGTAERVPLADASIDGVLVGQAWHWFDPASAVAEVRRSCGPAGPSGCCGTCSTTASRGAPRWRAWSAWRTGSRP